MKRADLEHILRAAGSIAETQQLVVVGSQALLGSFPNPPPELTVSQEADVYVPDAPEKSDLIDGSIGEKSPFHETFGYYAHGVGHDTAVLPSNWQTRLVPLQNPNTRGVTGLCLSPVDLALSKLVAGREKDLEFVRLLLKHRMLGPDDLQRVSEEMEPKHIPTVRLRLAAVLKQT